MGISVYIRNLTFVLIAFAATLGLWSCSKTLDAGLNSNSHEKVFDMVAHLSPKKYDLALSDTIWISKQYNFTDKLFDMVTEDSLSLTDAQFFCAIQVEDQIDPDTIVNFAFVLENGVFLKREGNAIGFSFGYPETIAEFKLGIVLTDPGRYAIWFNNQPNPFTDCNDDCEGDLSYYFDVYHYYNAISKSFENKDFVDYKFDFVNYATDDPKIEPYLRYAIYPKSIFVCTVR